MTTEPAAAPATPRRPGLVRRLFVGLLRIVAALALALVLAEVAVRVAGLRIPPWIKPENHNLLLKPDEDKFPGVHTMLRPGASATRHYPGLEPDQGRDVVYQINRLGFRDREDVQVAKPEGSYRIVTIGDSVTYGTGVDLDQTIAKHLERELSERLPGVAFEVLNCGVPGTNTGQQVALFRHKGVKFEPDLVLLVTTIVDASGHGVQNVLPKEKPWQVEWIERLGLTTGVYEHDRLTDAQKLQVTLRQNSALADLVCHHLYRSLYWDVLVHNYRATWVPDGPGVTMIRRSLGQLDELTSRRDMRLHVGMYPFLSGLQDSYPFGDEVQQMAGLCAERELPFHDLLEPLKGYPPVALQAHRHDRHPSGRANGLVVDWLVERLLPDIREDLGR